MTGEEMARAIAALIKFQQEISIAVKQLGEKLEISQLKTDNRIQFLVEQQAKMEILMEQSKLTADADRQEMRASVNTLASSIAIIATQADADRQEFRNAIRQNSDLMLQLATRNDEDRTIMRGMLENMLILNRRVDRLESDRN